MTPDTVANAFAGGLLTGLVYGLSAVGLSVIFGVIRIVNFAHGEMMVVGMYIALVLFRKTGLDPFLSVPAAAATMFGFGYAFHRAVLRRVAYLPDYMQFLLLAAFGLVLASTCLGIFGPDAQGVQLRYSTDSIALGTIVIDKPRLYAAAAALVVSTLLLLFFRYSATGRAIRACADNPLGARIVGLDVDRLYALTLGIGAACVGAAGCILLPLVDVEPYLGSSYTLLGFVIVIIGGLGSLYGALLSGMLIGVSESLASLVIEPSLKTAVSFGLLILVLLLRPRGLLGGAPQ